MLMVSGVPLALLGAGSTGRLARTQEVGERLGVTSADRQRDADRPAQLRADLVESNAGDELLDVVLCKAGVGAGRARLRAVEGRIDRPGDRGRIEARSLTTRAQHLERAAHDGYEAGAAGGAASLRSVRSTCLVSYASRTSPIFTSSKFAR